MRARTMPLSWRIFAANAAVFVAAASVLLFTPATVSHPADAGEAAILVAGVCIMLIANLYLVRHALAPLTRLASDMNELDPLDDAVEPARRTAPVAEVAQLATSFDGMRERLRHERRESARRAAHAQEEERRQVARELHDQVGQVLTGLLLLTDRAITDVDVATRERLVPVREAAREALEDVRRVARQLRPEMLDELGLAPALRALVNRFAQDSGLEVQRRLDAGVTLDHDAELAIYRIAQEALTNVARHARARRVEVELVEVEGGVRLSICDDGVGIDDCDPSRRSGGLRWMQERARTVDGSLTIAAHAERGTTVTVEVPAGGAGVRR